MPDNGDVKASQALQSRVATQLAEIPTWERDVFLSRVDAQWDALASGLAAAFGPGQVEPVASRLLDVAVAKFLERPSGLHALDSERLGHPGWLQSERMVGYAAYTERFAGNLAGVAERVPYLKELGVTYLHLMPLLTPRPGDSDGGHAVMDHRTVRPDLGTMDDLERLATTLRDQGISLSLDLVLNHVAAEHDWAARARAGEEKYRNYFHLFDDRALPDEYERTLPDALPDSAPGNFTWDASAHAWVWTTFHPWQWDLNWSNPDVVVEFADLVLFLANKGVEIVRLNALPFIWKRQGTACRNEPEVHALTAVLRAIARIAAPALAFEADTRVNPKEVTQYFGVGQYAGRLSDLACHHTLMVQLWSMLAARDTRLTVQTLRALPPTPPSATWVTYARCQDDIAWIIDDDRATEVGVSGPLHRAFLSDWYAGDLADSPSDGLVFQTNPSTGDRRISGTMASLTGASETYNEELARSGVERMKLITAALYGFGGIPVIWSGDELALPNDPDWDRNPSHASDNRWSHRPCLPDDAVAARHNTRTTSGAVFEWCQHLAQRRAALPQLHASIPSEVLPVANPAVLAWGRRHRDGDMVQLYNVTGSEALWPGDWLRGFRLDPQAAQDDSDGFTGLNQTWHVIDALTGERIRTDAAGDIKVPALHAVWLVGAR